MLFNHVTLPASNLYKLFSSKQVWNSIWINYEHLRNVLVPNPTNYKPNWWIPGTGQSSWLVTWPQKSTSGRHAFSNAETGIKKYLNNITERKIYIFILNWPWVHLWAGHFTSFTRHMKLCKLSRSSQVFSSHSTDRSPTAVISHTLQSALNSSVFIRCHRWYRCCCFILNSISALTKALVKTASTLKFFLLCLLMEFFFTLTLVIQTASPSVGLCRRLFELRTGTPIPTAPDEVVT